MHAVDVGVQCMIESLTLGHNLDFSSCDIMVGICKSNHICVCCAYTYMCADVCMCMCKCVGVPSALITSGVI